ncbi:hypothetical protein WJX72_006621 [[Myrmecia] bisecta]|uniref:SS18 N-terminal domain-containing protein n=1 Tax=[Myrmecia] bisecta TaxID=41462 RepID=A0AAW1PSH8_9CHLO
MQTPQPAAATSAAPASIPTETIQQYLEDNSRLIETILQQLNSGKPQVATTYQQRLQQNLMWLAAIADAQPHNPTAHLAQPAPTGNFPDGA